MATQPIYAMTDTWSSLVTEFDAIKMDVTDGDSAENSKLLNFSSTISRSSRSVSRVMLSRQAV